MVKILTYSLDKDLTEETDLSLVAERLKELETVVWLDFENPSDKELQFLEETLQFHPLALEDCKTRFNLPKIDNYGDYIFLIWHVAKEEVSQNEQFLTLEIDFFVGKNYLVSIHNEKVSLLEEVYSFLKGDPNSIKRDSGWLLYTLLDLFTDTYFPLMDNISNTIDLLEDKIFENPRQEHLRKLFTYKHQLLYLRKVISPEREIVVSLIHYNTEIIKEHSKIYFADIQDHLIRIMDLIDTDRDVISGAMDIYLSQVSNRLNEVVKKLTIITFVFMPLTLISGIYGMNFQNMPELTWTYGYYFVLLVMILVAISIVIYFKKLGWW